MIDRQILSQRFFLFFGFTKVKALKILLFSFLCSLLGLWILFLTSSIMQGNVRKNVTYEVVQSGEMIASIFAVDKRIKEGERILIENKYFNVEPKKYLGKTPYHNIVAYDLKKVHGQKRKLSSNIYAVRFIDVKNENKKK